MKKYILLVISLLGSSVLAKAQTIDPDYDMGDITAGDSRLADFDWRNDGAETVYILRADVPDNCTIRFSTKELKPGEAGMIRIKYNPKRKGPFKEKIPVYFSAQPDPVILTISGYVKYVDESMDIACPNFNTPEEEKQVRQPFVVQVVDKTTGQPIGGAIVKYSPNPLVWPRSITGGDGSTKATIPIGLYDLQASARGYKDEMQELYIGKDLTSTVFMLEPLPQQQKPGPDTLLAVRPPDETPETPRIKEKPGELPVSEFVPNNIVFLIDVSSSMAYPDKLPLLKVAMKNLLYNLREVDRISIVTYASGTDVLLQSTTADKKEKIADRIDGLKASGTTQGGKGIREAYKVAQEHFIKGGNNQIILATDGDFNLDHSDDALFKFIQDNSANGISLSVVGFGQKERAIQKMKKIAGKGQGSYLHVGTEEEAGPVLVEEIKQRSRK